MELAAEIRELKTKIVAAETLLRKDYVNWTKTEKNTFGGHKQLRKNITLLKGKERQLREENITLLKLKEPSKIDEISAIFEQKVGELFERVSTRMDETVQKLSSRIEIIETAINVIRDQTTRTDETVQDLSSRMDLKHSEIMKRMDSIQTALDPVVDNYHIMLRYLNEKKAVREPDFKKSLLRFYFNITAKVFVIKCMITGVEFPTAVVIASHLFKFSWAEHCGQRLDFKDINDPRNGLLMLKPFEHAFDAGHLCFQYDVADGGFKLKILYPKLKEMTIG